MFAAGQRPVEGGKRRNRGSRLRAIRGGAWEASTGRYEGERVNINLQTLKADFAVSSFT